MAFIHRVEPVEYQAFVNAFEKVGSPVYAKVAKVLNQWYSERGVSKTITIAAVRKAWQTGWAEQHGGAPAPAIKTLFPQFETRVFFEGGGAAKISSPAKQRAPESGIGPAPAAAPETPPTDTVRQEEGTITLITTTPDTTAASVPIPTDPLQAAMARLDIGRVNALLNEGNFLSATRKNLIGVSDLVGLIVEKLRARSETLLKRLLDDLEHSDATSLKVYRDTLRDVMDIQKDLTLSFKTTQEAQRLLVGMPQKITEERGPAGDKDVEERKLGRMAGMLRVRADSSRPYGGEESDRVIDVEVTTTSVRSSDDAGQGVANEAEPEPKVA